jgi:hypothetical protein
MLFCDLYQKEFLEIDGLKKAAKDYRKNLQRMGFLTVLIIWKILLTDILLD